ncbi:hypothetical protein PVL29_004773 [Vitis rotundifolia]|uniref:Uncharacterized protein n=1 Tax=Vitis rotundifolia TaxID=103349 RepID=A0AA39DYT0_VITRO|nr:hypothetical protein PVL29_004773 [Vitis rotundifolia]
MLPVYSYSKELEVGRRVHASVEMVNFRYGKLCYTATGKWCLL